MNRVNVFLCFIFPLLLFAAVGCSSVQVSNEAEFASENSIADTVKAQENTLSKPHLYADDYSQTLDSALWMDMKDALRSSRFEILYASASNFTGRQIYDCGRCFLRKSVGERLVDVEKNLVKLGFGLIIYDCYRPAPYQQILWDVKPDPRYVMPPEKGSNHSRGISIDLGLYYLKDGSLVDMGTPVDFMGRASHWDYLDFSPVIINNRNTLRRAMEKLGFSTISTEWWHYDFAAFMHYPLSADLWSCP